jgi:hypothetical protein
MAISDSEKLDLLWKKVNFGVSKTATATSKAGSNETVASPLSVYASNIWTQTSTDFIPAAPPAASTTTVQVMFGANAIRMTNDTTSAPNLTWLAASIYGVASSTLTDFIPPTFGAGYSVQVYLGNPATKAARIFPDTTGEEWTFDYNAGVLNFIGGLPTAKSATIGTGTVSLTDGVYIQVYRYTGSKGVAASGATSKNYVVADIPARDALTGLTAGDQVFVTDASGIPTDAAAGEYAVYIWTGSAFVVVATQDSARSDSLTSQVEITPASTGTIALGNIGNGSRVVEVAVLVDSAFDGDLALVVGDATVEDRLLNLDMADLQSAGNYVVYPTYVFPAGQETPLSITLSGAATAGHALVSITYA